ncbi:MAG: Cof-type HAD-IIB family hydrolase [Lachnospiraceae bacterium]|nr:Cof-type HAD-IIB family hydrolase [Lachnospiraceae bacterium]
MNKSAIFFDIDGTLWDYEQKLIPSTIDAVRKLRANGHLAFLCSGRSRASIISKELLDIGFDGIVGGCGTYFEYEGDVIFSNEIPWEILKRDIDTFKEINVSAIYEGVDYLFVDTDMFPKTDPYINSLREALKTTFKELKDINSSSRVNKYSVDFRHSSEELLRSKFEGYNIVVHARSTVAEIMPSLEYSKASGMKRAINYLGIDQADTYAFGDSFNDLDMLEYAAHSVAMGNAVEAVKEMSEYITTDVNDDGIYNGLKAYGLI